MSSIAKEIYLSPSQEECERRLMANIQEQDVHAWLTEENLRTKSKRSFAGFEITASVDGAPSSEREVSLVQLLSSQVYPQHVHRHSDSLFIAVQGEAVLLSGRSKTVIFPGDRIPIPKGMPHGFELVDGKSFQFLSIQQPPIRDRITGEEDLTLVGDTASLTTLI